MSEQRRIKRFLLRRGETRDRQRVYADNKGNEYDYKWVAQLSSYFNIFSGCLKRGFPVHLKRLRYQAWAFYPFFFLRDDLKDEVVKQTIMHERIHIVQQVDLHLAISLPLIIAILISEMLFGSKVAWFLLAIPFVPTIVNYLEILRVMFVHLRKYGEVNFQKIRKDTCFEREANQNCLNDYYLMMRKRFTFLSYTGIKCFLKIGGLKKWDKEMPKVR